MKFFKWKAPFLLIVFFINGNIHAQRFLTEFDSSLFVRDTLRPLVKQFENLKFTGYLQPQFQVAEAEGISSYEGGNFSAHSKSRFMLRRARLKTDYLIKKGAFPQALFTFQLDATERGVIIWDMYMRLFETRYNNFSIWVGVFNRPFGYEVNLSSAYRETPERGRMSQILHPGERDLGAMVSFEPQRRTNKLWHFKLDAGFFNGQGLRATTDFDTYKDFISRLTVRPYKLKNIELAGGLSFLYGGWRQFSKYVYTSATDLNGDKVFAVDSSESNIGKKSERTYYGADAQVKFHHSWGATELRGEYWFGKQPGTSTSTANPTSGIVEPIYIRNFDGAFLMFLQNIVNDKHQLIVKYDWYDPNTEVKESNIGKPGTNLTVADIKFSTLGLGYAYHFNKNTKVVFYYALVDNENTQLTGYTSDIPDNVFTCRFQYRF